MECPEEVIFCEVNGHMRTWLQPLLDMAKCRQVVHRSVPSDTKDARIQADIFQGRAQSLVVRQSATEDYGITYQRPAAARRIAHARFRIRTKSVGANQHLIFSPPSTAGRS